ncbi:hypothetical protein [Rhizobium sp. HT1-10]|uniref:hypothetical protein n=1 Tax=Rhizobium sp. HT1-10 TaxID=3111638 RepID=UPI003C169D3A
MAVADAKWKASIPSKAMIKSERSVLKQLLEHGPGVQVHWRHIKSCGPGTSERLEARVFIELRMQKKHPDRLEGYILTEAGRDAAMTIRGET